MPDRSEFDCDAALRVQVAARLQDFAVQAHAADRHHRAAVAVAIAEEGTGADLDGIAPVVGWSRRAALLLTRRAGHLRTHAGQWALPGGRIDPGETPEDAALRELVEEVGLALGADAVLGRLDDYATRSGFVITPVVVWAGAAVHLHPNPDEVASVHRIRVDEFLRADAPWLEAAETDPGALPGAPPGPPVLRMPVGSGWIAAPTAAVLYQFRELCLCGRPTRVAHYDQPRFAWK